MTNGTEVTGSTADLRRAEVWLGLHGLTGTQPTTLLDRRLAVRGVARIASALLLAGLAIAAAITLAYDRFATGRSDGSMPHSRTPLVIMAVLVLSLALAQAQLDRWVRRADRRAAATLSRRMAYPVPLGWRTVVGRGFALHAVGAVAAATLLAVSCLTVPDANVRFGAVILLIALFGSSISIIVQMRDVLTRPVVATDEDSLLADVIMRIEDARERVSPVVVWLLPAVVLYGDELGWWNAAALALTVGAAVGLTLVHLRSGRPAAVARRALGAR